MASRQRDSEELGTLVATRELPEEEQRDVPTDPHLRAPIPTRLERMPSAPVKETRVAPLDVPSSGELPEYEGVAPPSGSNRTTFSFHAALFADVVRERFANKMFGRNPRRILRVDEPEGPSTAGGLLARQAISLVARRGIAPTLVCGWMDISRKEAQLRSYEALSRRHEAHLGAILDLPQAEYERFLDELSGLLTSEGFQLRLVVPEEAQPPAPRDPAPPPRGASVPLWLAVLAAGLAFWLGLFVGRR